MVLDCLFLDISFSDNTSFIMYSLDAWESLYFLVHFTLEHQKVWQRWADGWMVGLAQHAQTTFYHPE